MDGMTNPTALAVGVASILVIVAFRRWLPTVPGILSPPSARRS